MKKAVCFALALLMLCLICTGCAEVQSLSDNDNMNWAKGLNSVKIEKVTASMNDISFDGKFVEYISEHTEGNYMVSPLSFRYALGLLIAGAQGESKTELMNALGVKSVGDWTAYCNTFNGFIQQFNDRLAKEIEEYNDYVSRGWINEDSSEPFRALRVANSVWKNENIREDFTEGYKDHISKNYAAEYKSFTAENAIDLINEWASEKTEKMIEKLLPDDYGTDNLAVVLMNALYFKDSWVYPFKKNQTRDGIFTAESGKKVTKTFMKQTKDFYYYSDDNTQLVIIPMQGDLYMTFVIGDTSNISEKVSKAAKHSVTVTIPKIDIETTFNHKELLDFLAENGVSKAFDPYEADFSAMIDYPIWVDDIIHKTRIKLDEDGVEAAAVTMIAEKPAQCPPVETEKPFEFTADEPFSFYIYTTCNETTAMLFAGEIVE